MITLKWVHATLLTMSLCRNIFKLVLNQLNLMVFLFMHLVHKQVQKSQVKYAAGNIGAGSENATGSGSEQPKHLV